MRSVRPRTPAKKLSPPTAELNSAAQVNAAVMMKVAEVMQVLCGVAGPAVQSALATPAANAPVPVTSAAEIVDAMLNRMYRRMPKSGTKDSPAEHCPFTGLNRSALYELFSLRDENGNPVIKTISMREADEKRGARFYSVGSVLSYLDRLAAEQFSECAIEEDHGEHS